MPKEIGGIGRMQNAVKKAPADVDGLLKLVAAGNKDALAELYAQTKGSVYAYALSTLRSRADAEDVMQDVYVMIWQNAGSYKSVGRAMGWIIALTKNACLMKIRSRRFISDEPIDPAAISDTALAAVSPEEAAAVRLCLTSLGGTDREIVILHAVSGLKHREIAKLLGLPLSTVLSKYQRSVKKLKKMLLE